MGQWRVKKATDMREPVLPVNPITPVLVILALAMAGIEALLSAAEAGLIGGAGGIGWRLRAVQDWGFSPVVWDQVVALGNHSGAMLRRFVGYGFIHGGVTHALFAIAMLLALGKVVGEVFAPWAVLAVFLAGLVAGAVAFGLVAGGGGVLIGAYPGVYALIGALSWLMYARIGQQGGNRLQAFRLIGFLLLLQFLFAALSPLIGGGIDLTFVAELAGFGAGFALSVVVSPGGFAALRARLRERRG